MRIEESLLIKYLVNIANKSKMPNFKAEDAEDIIEEIGYESLEIPFTRSNDSYDPDIGSNFFFDRQVVLDSVLEYFSPYITAIDAIDLKCEFFHVNTVEDFMLFVREKSELYNMPHEHDLLVNTLYFFAKQDDNKLDSRGSYVESEIGKTLIIPSSIDTYVKAIDKWNKIGVNIPFSALDISVSVPDSYSYNYLGGILTYFIEWVFELPELVDISKFINSVEPQRSVYNKLFALFDSYQSLYEQSQS